MLPFLSLSFVVVTGLETRLAGRWRCLRLIWDCARMLWLRVVCDSVIVELPNVEKGSREIMT